MSEQETQSKEAQKTVIAFVAGLLIGGLLVWVFGGTPSETPTVDEENDAVTEVGGADDDDTEETDDSTGEEADAEDTEDDTSSRMETGSGSVDIEEQQAGMSVVIEGAVFPTDEGWIGVRDYTDGQLGSILGVARYSKEQGLIPSEITLLRATESGNDYAIVFYSENGDRDFNLATDVQVEGVVETFIAQ